MHTRNVEIDRNMQKNALEEVELKKARLQKLMNVVVEMKARGIKIDFARRASFLSDHAKNAVEVQRKLS